jgi:serine/threonine protein kinase
MTEDWTKEWERRTVNGVYPLRRFLGRSNHSVVFLTEYKTQNAAPAAIKILPANPALADSQLAYWKRVARLSHPHLIRLLDAGRCQLGGHNFLFVVTDHAEQNLAQILPARPLTADEVQDLLPPTLDALAYLRDQNLVHGGLKPPNFLVVDDQLKLASDTIRPAGGRTASTVRLALYDPPEAKKGRASAAGDIWALGITLVEALTQTAPTWSRERPESISLPANLAPQFVDTVQRCLHLEAGQRPTIAELVAQFKQAPVATPSSAARPAAPPAAQPVATPSSTAPTVTDETLARRASTQNSPKKRLPVTAISVGIVGIVALGAAWTGVHLLHTHSNLQQSSSMTPESLPAVSPPAAMEKPKASIAAPLPTVLHQEIPDVSRRARESIHGVINIGVRVIVDRSGNVVAAALDNRAPGKYFARAAMNAAKKWKFAEAADQASRVWLLRFEFSRAGTTADAAAVP